MLSGASTVCCSYMLQLLSLEQKSNDLHRKMEEEEYDYRGIATSDH